ncbi:MAG: discoidin domain-containing protein [Gammaproteobacteria bacterium]
MSNTELGSQTAVYNGGGISGVTLIRAVGHELSELGSTGFLSLSGSNLTYTPPGGAAGAAVSVATDGTYTVFGAAQSAGVVVTTVSPATGTDNVTIAQPMLNLFDQLSGGELTAGHVDYRAVIIKNTGADTLTNLGVYVEEQPKPALWSIAIGSEATTSTGGGNPISAPGAHRYWHINITDHAIALDSSTPPDLRIGELELRSAVGGADITTPATVVSVSHDNGINLAANLVDDNVANYWQGAAATVTSGEIIIDLGAGNDAEVLELQLTPTNLQHNRMPGSFTLGYSDDGVHATRIDVMTASNQAWENNVAKQFAVPVGGTGQVAQYLRYTFTESATGGVPQGDGSWASLSELEVYEVNAMPPNLLAPSLPVGATSHGGGSASPGRAIDNLTDGLDDGNSWAARNSAPVDTAPVITVDLGEAKAVGGYRFKSRTDTNQYPVDWTVESSLDRANWVLIDTQTGWAPASNGADEDFPVTLPTVTGAATIQTIVDEVTAPSGITLLPHPFGSDLVLSDLAHDDDIGLWVGSTVTANTVGVASSIGNLKFRLIP